MNQQITINPADYLSVGSYAKQYRKADGSIGTNRSYIYKLIREEKIPQEKILEIDGFVFIKR